MIFTYMSRIFDPVFWFAIMPQPLSVRSTVFLLFFFGFFGLLMLTIFFTYKKRKSTLSRPEKDLYLRIRSFLLTSWLLGWLWLFFAYEGVRFFSARFWFILWGLMVCFWIYTLVRHVLVDLPSRLNHISSQKVFNKYLHRRKK